jgi:cytoskeleton protein RodZ
MENDLADAGNISEKATSAGRLLNRKRLDRGFDLADAARATRIPLRHLEAIEKDNYDRLPAYPYAVGFVRNYAKYLGLTADEVVNQFKAETTLMDPTLTATVPEPLDESRMPSRGMIIGGLAAAAALIGAGAWFLSRTPEAPSAEEPVEAIGTVAPDAASVSPPVMSESSAPPVGQPMVAPAPVVAPTETALPAVDSALVPPTMPNTVTSGVSSVGIVLRANEDSWIKVSDGVSPSLRVGILKAGDTYTVPNVPGLKLLTGNAGGLDIFVDGKQLPPLGSKGTTARAVPMNAAGLQNWQSSNSTAPTR